MRTYMKRTMSCALVLLMLVGMLGAMALPVAAASKITGVKVVAENAAEYAYSNGTVPYPSSMLVDGIIKADGNMWHTLGSVNSAYVTLDLGNEYELTEIRSYARYYSDALAARNINKYQVWVSDFAPVYSTDGAVPAGLAETPTHAAAMDKCSTAKTYGTIILPEATVGRFVTILIENTHTTGAINIGELEFYGEATTDDSKLSDIKVIGQSVANYSASFPASCLVDGISNNYNSYFWGSAKNTKAAFVTFDMQKTVSLSEMLVYMRPLASFTGRAFSDYEIFVSDTAPTYHGTDGSLPTGLPVAPIAEGRLDAFSDTARVQSIGLPSTAMGRYVTIYMINLQGGTQIDLAEIEFFGKESATAFSETLMKSDITSVTSDSTDSRYPIGNIYDGNVADPANYWSSGGSGAKATVTATLATAGNVEGVVLYPGQYPINFPGTIEILVSQDNVSYTAVASRSGFTTTLAASLTFLFPTSRAKFVRVVLTPADGRSYSQVLEMEVLCRPSVPTEIAEIRSTSTDSRYTVASLYDGNISNPTAYWSNEYDKEAVLTVTLSEAQDVAGITMYAGQHTVNFPGEIEISVSEDDVNYTTVLTKSGYKTDSMSAQYFCFTPQPDVKYLKVKLNPIVGRHYSQVLELEVLRCANVAEAMAQSIATIPVDYETGALILPQRNGCKAEIASVSNETVISKDGVVDTVVGGNAIVMLKVTDGEGNVAFTEPIEVSVLDLRQQSAVPADLASVVASTYDGQKNAGLLINDNVDGGRHGHYYSSAKDVDTSEIVLTMETSALVSGITLYPRQVSQTNFPLGMTVYLSADGQTWSAEPVLSIADMQNNNLPDAHTYFFAPQENIRYVKLILTRDAVKASYIQLAEINVLATPALQRVDEAVATLEAVQQGQKIVFENLDKQFETKIINSSNMDIVALDGSIIVPDEQTDVTLTLKVINRLDTADTATLTRTASVKTRAMLDTEAVAEETDLIPVPELNSDKITYPTVPDGYTIEIAESDTPTVVDTKGNIYRSDDTTYRVRLTFKITQTESGATALTKALLVPIYKTYVAPTMSEEEIAKLRADYEAKKYGAFVHYITSSDSIGHGTRYSDGNMLRYIDEAAESFDVQQFAKDMHDFGMEYVVLTVWHHEGETLYPSMTNQRWRDDRRTQPSKQKSYSDRDVIMGLLDELDKYGIDLHLYAHGSAGTDYNAEDLLNVGWNDSADNYGIYNQYINEMFFELCERYGTRLKGLWVDGVFNHIPRGAAQERLKETCRTFNPAMVLTMNAGFVEGQLDIRTEENFPDYRCWEINRWVDYINDLKFSRYQVATCLAQQYWWTTVPQDYEFNMQPASEMFQYLVALSSVTQQGGMLASTGIYPVAAEKHGQENDLWLNGMKEMLLEVNSYLDPVAESVKNTSVGKAFPTTENITIKDLTWGVSTESRDGRNVYLHVLKAPEGNTLTLPATADGTELKSDAVIMNFDKTTTPVTLTKTASGYTVTLPEGVEWNEVDTVIKTTRVGYGAAGIGEQNFETLEEALAAAEAKDVIKLYTDVEADRVILNPEVTLDLNGNTLAADYFVGFKGSAVYGGKLKAPKDKVVLDRTNNGYLSVYDADGYVFTTVKLTGRAKFVSDTTYAFSPVFESVVHKMLEQGYEKSGVSVVVRVTWKDTGNYEAKQDYIYLDEMVQRVIGSYDETKLNYKRAFSAAFAGSEAGAAENVKVSAVVLSETGVEIASSAFTFEG